MAGQQQSNGVKPKRKRQRRRRQISDDSDSSSDSSDSSSEETPVVPQKLPTPEESSDSDSDSSESDSSESDSSSSEEESSDDGRGRRRSRGQKQGAETATATTSTPVRRPYPSRSPSPASADPANLPLGQSLFPLLKPLPDGPLFDGLVPGDTDYVSTSAEPLDEEMVAREKAREDKFGAWWRARLVSEFEGELGELAAEPGVNPTRLSLLLTSLTSLSSLHTTSSSLAASTRSIWLHDPNTSIDPLAALNVEEGAEEWTKMRVGGEGDIEVGVEGVEMEETKEDMQVDEV